MSGAGLTDEEVEYLGDNERLRYALRIAREGLRYARGSGFQQADDYLKAMHAALTPPPEPTFRETFDAVATWFSKWSARILKA